MPRARGPEKVHLSVSLSPAVRLRLEQMAAAERRSLSAIVEELVLFADQDLDDYFRKQGAFHGYMAAAVSAALAHKILGPEATRELQDRAATTARRLYGRSPVRNFEVEHGLPDELDDPRVWALFAAYGAPTVTG